MKPLSRGRVGISGTGFIARQISRALRRTQDLASSYALTRRSPAAVTDFPEVNLLTHSVDRMVNESDLIVECSGAPFFAFEVVKAAQYAGRPVVTINSEFQMTFGS